MKKATIEILHEDETILGSRTNGPYFVQEYKDGEVMGISLKKTGATAYYEKVNLDGLIPDTSEYNFDAPMSDFYSSFKIGSDGMFTQDVKITIDATQENKTFVFQIKANDSGSTSGSNLKFEPTAKGSGTARLGKAPVDEVVELLKDAKSTAVFVNKYQDYPYYYCKYLIAYKMSPYYLFHNRNYFFLNFLNRASEKYHL